MKTTKAEILKALKEKVKDLSEADKTKFGPELVAALTNASENDLELNEARMRVQVGHFEINYTAVGENDSMSRTINDSCATPSAIWIKEKFLADKDGDGKGKKKTMNQRDTENHYANGLYDLAKEALGIEYGDPKCIFGYDSIIVDNFVTEVAKDYFYSLNMSLRNSRVNKSHFVAETDEAIISMAVVWLHYKRNGKDCVCFVGRVDDLLGKQEEKIIIAIQPEKNRYKSHSKGKTIVGWLIGLGIVAAIVLIMLTK